jgi:uncharacterized DUF497 family protein
VADYEFDWDAANVGHIARHDVMPEEVEEVFSRPYAIEIGEPVHGEDRFLIHGTTALGRYLTVVFTERQSRARPISAWDMTREDREEYADEIHD